MQRLQTVFQLSVVVLLCAAATIFAAAEEQPLVSLTVPASLIAWAAVDRRGRAGLGPGWSFAFGLLAVMAAVFEFATGGIEARILAPSHLLAYLVWIVLFQHKENRHYWILLGLTVLQVAIASLLTNASWLGAAVIVYSSLALWTMGVFTLQRSVQRVGLGTSGAVMQRSNRGAQAMRNHRSAVHPGQASHVQNSVHLDAGERLIGWHFTGGAAVMTLLSLSLSGLFFLFIPRIWPSQYQLFNDSPLAGARPLTGFTDDVRLGDMGEILESNELVLEISLFDTDTDQAIAPENYAKEFGSADPFFRGQVMEIYSDSRWQRFHSERLFGGNWRLPMERNSLRQHIRLQPIGSEILFAAGRLLNCEPSEGREEFVRDSIRGTYRRGEEGDVTRRLEYDAFSSRLGPIHQGIDPNYRRQCLTLPRGLDRLEALVSELLPEGEPRGELERANRIVAYLRDNDAFSYSLDLSVDDPTVDPVVDFLFNRKRGHCEYYASALALLLRTAGIPARVVSGFKGGDFNKATGQYEVRQLHAHLWVEAYINGAWAALDSTPPARDEQVAQMQATPTSVFSRFRESWESMWSQGVRLSRADQDRLLYEPIRDGAQGAWNAIRDLRGTSSRIGELLRALGTSPERWISWRGGVAVFVLLVIGSGLWALVRRLWRLLRRIRGAATESGRQAPVVAFYERYRRAAARAGYERGGTQTPREFAGTLSERLQMLMAPSAPPIPQFITESYYRVRYGNEELRVDELEALQRQLDDLDRQFTTGNGRDAR